MCFVICAHFLERRVRPSLQRYWPSSCTCTRARALSAPLAVAGWNFWPRARHARLDELMVGGAPEGGAYPAISKKSQPGLAIWIWKFHAHSWISEREEEFRTLADAQNEKTQRLWLHHSVVGLIKLAIFLLLGISHRTNPNRWVHFCSFLILNPVLSKISEINQIS